MADFAPPSGPPPPKVPEGWKAQWNEQYKEWFYVNLHTKQSQWDRPTEPVYASQGGPPPGPPPPTYGQNSSKPVGQEKSGYLSSNNLYSSGHSSSQNVNISDDEALARKLQEEENARIHGSGGADRGASSGYYGGSSTSPAPQYGGASQYGQAPQYGQGSQYGQAPQYGQGAQYASQQDLPARDGKSKGGFLGKLLGKTSSSRPQQGYGGGGYGGGGGGYPQQGYPQQGYGGYQQQGGYYGQQPPKKSGGMGMGGAAALGVGGGLVGGMLLADAIDDHDDHEYDQGYNDGQDNGDYGGGDDMGGGDF